MKPAKKKKYSSGLTIKPGEPPATLQARLGGLPTTITVLAYGPEKTLEIPVHAAAELDKPRKQFPVIWVQVAGLGDLGLIQEIGDYFKIHHLALEDLLGGAHRPKLEESGRLLFMVLQAAHRLDQNTKFEQIGIFFEEGVVITFQEGPAVFLDPLRERIKRSSGRIRVRGADYLAYAMVDSVVDHYFPVLESIGDGLEDLEDLVVLSPDHRLVHRINEVKRELLHLRRSLWPVREVTAALLDHAGTLVKEDTRPFIRDCHDNVIQAVDLIASYREVAAALSDLYLSALSNRMNEIMKVLTIIATIFIPLTFIVGVYGMNFDSAASPWNMPELKWKYGYPAVWAVMLVAALIMFVFFRKRKWL
ncbi:MAG: magnesium/cobalt transporter CorA [Pseudomonadota bacterium]